LEKNTSSAALHQYKVANSSKYLSFGISKESLSGKNQVTHKAPPLEIIETLCTGSVFGNNFQTIACQTS
jgi:hypothetical protein